MSIMHGETNPLDTPDRMYVLHELVLDELIARIQSGEASTGDLATAVKFLNTNNISIDLSKPKQLAVKTVIPRLTHDELTL